MKKIVYLTLVAVMAFVIAGCGDTQTAKTPSVSPSASRAPVPTATPMPASAATLKPTPTPAVQQTTAPKQASAPVVTTSKYQQIYNEYARKIKANAPNMSITELAEISNEGIGKMAEYMYSASGKDGQYATYQEWAGKLMDVYMNEAR